MLFGILILYVTIQASVACWSTTIIFSHERKTGIEDLPTPPSMTKEQENAMFMLSQELDMLSCEELQNRVYNTTESPIQLSDDQMMGLMSSYPQSFKEPVNEISGSNFQCAEEVLSPLQRKRRSTIRQVRVCSSTSVYSRFHLALDKDGEPVVVPQLIGRFNLVQEFNENLCSADTCIFDLQCQCQNQLSHTATAVVAYVRRQNPKFYESEIQLRSCSAYI